MLPRTGREYVYAGATHVALQNMQANIALRHKDGGALDTIDWYLDHLKALGLSMTYTAAWHLRTFHEELGELDPSSGLTDEDAKRIRDLSLMLRETLYAEAGSHTLYEVTGKRFDTKVLLHDVRSLMRDGVYEELPPTAAFDVDEAATCIAFERPTAAAFHALRATEAVLRNYYASVVGSRRIKKPWLWKPMLNDLTKPGRRKKPPKALTDHLDSIREHFRNPTQHPEKIYDVEEAQDLFGQALGAIERMVCDTHWRKPPETTGELIARLTATQQATTPDGA